MITFFGFSDYLSRDLEWRDACAAVIPCLNEARTIGAVVLGVRKHVRRVYVVDDGSTDRTSHYAAAAGATVLRNPSSLGKGAALRSAWEQAAGDGFGWILAMDGDGQHAPEDIPEFFKRADETAAPLVIGNRMHAAGEMPWVRRQVNRWMSERLSKVAGQALPDSQCGFRLVQLETLQRIPLSANHYEMESEQALAFARAGERIEFVPIRVIYNGERSDIHPVRDTIRWFRWLGKWKRQKRAK